MKAEKQYRSPTCLPNNTKSTSPTLQFIDNRQETAIQAQLIQVIQQAGITYPCIQCKIGEGKAIGQVIKNTETGDTYTIVAVQEGQYTLEALSTSSSTPSSVDVDFDDERYVCQPPDSTSDSEDTRIVSTSSHSSETGSDDEIPSFLRGLDDTLDKEDDTQEWDFGSMEKEDNQSSGDEEDKEDDQTEEKESLTTELIGGKQGITDYIHQQLGFLPTLRIPSLAYLYGKSQISEDFRELPDFFAKEIKQILSAEIGQEDHVVVYHSTSIFSYLFTEITGFLYKKLNKSIDPNFVFFRDFANPKFQQEESPTSFLKEKIFTRGEETSEKKVWTDHKDHDLLLSVNLSLLGHYANTGEQSYHFGSAGGVGRLSKPLPNMIEELSLAEEWKQALLPPIIPSIRTLCEQINDILRKRQSQPLSQLSPSPKETRDSVLYQIFIPKEILDRCMYIAQVNGTPLSKPIVTLLDLNPQSIFEGMAAAGKANQLNDLETYGNTYFHMPPTTDLCSFFTSGEFTQMVFKAARYKEFWKVFDTAWAEPQARILFNATTNPFTNPDITSPEGIKTNTYLLLSQEIRDIVMPALAEIKELIEQTSL